MPVKWISVLLLLQMSCYFRSGNCGKVLVWPMEYSHWMNLKIILDELAQRGHEVTVLRPSSSIFLDPTKSSGLIYETYPTASNNDEVEKFLTQWVNMWTYDVPKRACWRYYPSMNIMFGQFSDLWLKLCREVVSNKPLMAKLKESKFDVVLSDAIGPCGRPTTMVDTMKKAEIWLIRSYWDLEFPRPSLPNIEFVGGLHCKPANPLPKEMEEFAQSSGEHGVVVFSLGSMIRNITQERANTIASAFAQIPQKVLWRFEGQKPDTLGPNTRIFKWMPQNDLLGHPKTKVFVTHGGANGIYEAIHHGIPMVGIPLFAEQHDNIAHMVAKGAAISLDFHTMTSSDLLNALKEVIKNLSYKKNVMWLSTIHHDQPMKPLDRAAFWIEFVMRHKGAKHLKPLAYNLTWYQYHSLDVIGFLLACVAAIAFFTIKCCLFVYGFFVKKGKNKTE
ncbi:UDP-glucuronosyltransferase 2B7 isoform X1 [Cricetulus griseus]|uniref:UDP-glucuronosyltransferase 2B7 isoform X1 n=1 Tax=Cricetulus griseus TaxID=10029 RepID=UPI0015C3BD98|nr:UDP-glucuronosyltransferase 2B7 isoform X1 [Cricetulus griseus]